MDSRNSLRDQVAFNCTELADLNYILDLYQPQRRNAIRKFLMNAIADNTIHQSTYMEVYKLIKKKFSYHLPGSSDMPALPVKDQSQRKMP